MAYQRLLFSMLCALVGLTMVAAPAERNRPAESGPPEVGVAVITDGRTLEIHRFVEGTVTRKTVSSLPPGITVKPKAGSIGPSTTTEVVPIMQTEITRSDATKAVAWRVDGREIGVKELTESLAKPTPVIIARRWRTIDPIFLKVFKPDTLVLPLPNPPSDLPDYNAPPVLH